MLRPLQMAHAFLSEVITKEDIVVDATMGNGHDTLFLAQLAKKVYAFDIQKQALEQTTKRLTEAKVDNVELLLTGHENVGQYIKSTKAAIFNLGYLPSADKSVITQPHTTIQALEKLCQCLVVGDVERDAVLDFVGQLPQQEFTVALYKTINQINYPPFLVMIEKLRTT